MTTYSHLDQRRFLLQWFSSWSQYQKEDFVPILAQKLAPKSYINGLVDTMESLNTSGRPPSIFQCQIKLFHEWMDEWNSDERQQLLQSYPSEFIDLVQTELKREEDEEKKEGQETAETVEEHPQSIVEERPQSAPDEETNVESQESVSTISELEPTEI